MAQNKQKSIPNALAIMLLMAFFTSFAQAQSVKLKMTNGTENVPAEGFLFFDSGGDLLFNPVVDPINAEQYNWTTWYQHNEDYTMTLVNPDGGGLRIEFEKLLVNNDYLSFYEGTVSDANLICTYTNNDYSTAFCSATNKLIVESHGNMTIRFTSDNQWRDEGWEAKVYRTTTFTPRPPVALIAACDNMMSLIPACKGATSTVLQYKIGSGSYQTYTQGSFVDLNGQTFPLSVTVRATVDDTKSAEKTFTFSTKIQNPSVPNYTPQYSANKITTFFPAKPDGVNDTYYIRWTINSNSDGTTENPLLWDASGHEFLQPSNTPHSVPAGDIDYTNVALATPFYIHFATRGTTCPDRFSDVVTVPITARYAPMPTISFETNGSNEGITTLECSLAAATIDYTIAGSTPTTSSTQYTGNFTVQPGTTVKAIAVKANYSNSDVASDIFVPEGSGGGTYGRVVLLDDREDHSWSYYSDGDQPIHKLNPADVKITYYGNSPTGRTTMTNASENGVTPTSFSATATDVQVNVGETENQFIYLKTLENENADGSGDYPYTMIPNPFQVRPKYSSAQANRTFVVTLTNSDTYDNWNHDNGSTVTISYGNTTRTINGPAANGTVNQSFTAAVGTQVTITFNANNNSWASYCRIAVAYDDNTTIFTTYNPTTSGYNPRTFTIATSGGGSDNNYRGFYAWRVKSLSSGLAIQRANGTNVGVNGIINAEEDIKFVTSNEDGNEVEFEALWAQAYVTTSTSTSGLNANVSYERNFMVLGSNPSTNSNTVTIGSGTTTNNGQNVPLYISVNGAPYSVTQFFYTPTEIGMAGSITKLAFYVNTGQNSNRNIRIYLNHTSSTAFEYDNGYYYTQALDESYLVYSGNQNFNNTGWKTITLDTPFAYDGSSYLSVAVIDMTGQRMRTPPTFRTYNATNRGIYGAYAQAPDLNTYNLYGGTRVSYIPQMQFTVTTSPLNNLTVPLTMTTYNPDGTGGSTSVTLSDDITCSADLKFENIKMNVQQIDGAGHDLVFGRGVTPATSGGTCVGYVFGTFGPVASSVMNNTIRLESGSFTHVYGAYHSSINITSSGNAMKVIFGDDYDRAIASNTALTIGEFLLTFGINFSDNHLDKVHVKSGTFNNRFYNGYYYTHNEARGSRNVIVDGGLFNCDFAGGINGGSATVEHIDIRVHGGEFKGAIYGSGEYASATGDRRLVVTGGDIEGWIAGGCNGLTSSSETTGGALDGDTYLYIGGNSIVNSNGNNTVIGYSTSLGGNIYGAGSGKPVALTMGQVNNSNVVIADNATIERNVFGGGNYGYVGSGESNVFVLGGSVSGSVFGGSNLRNGHIVNVTMKDGSVVGSLYGGSNEEGVISDLATVSMEGGTVSNVFGGGLGASTNMAAGTVVNVSGGTISNNVYGGGQLGTVIGNTNVTVSGGTMVDVYGAGKGGSTTAPVSGETFVTVTGGTVANVYGGGEAGDVSDMIYTPAVPAQTLTYGFEDGSSQQWSFVDNDGDGSSWRVVNVSDHSSFQVHGGSYLLVSTFNTTALAENWLISPSIELGGSFSFWVARLNNSAYTDYYSVYVSTDGNNYTRLTGPTVAPTSYTQVTVSLTSYSGTGYVAIVHTAQAVDQGYIFIDDVTINTPAVDEIIIPVVASSTVTINGGTVSGDVFGGGKLGKTSGNVVVNVFSGSIEGNVYGGAFGKRNEVYIAGTHTVNVTGGTINQNVYGGSRNADDALTFDHTGYDFSEAVNHVNISGGHVYYQVFAGGYFGETYGSVYTFIGANAINNAPNAAPTTNMSYNAAALLIDGSVWAGADFGNFDGENFGAATIKGHSNVYIDGTGYNTVSTQSSDGGYMNIGSSVIGTGTSCYAGEMGSKLIIRNYGQPIDNPDYHGKEAIIEPYSTATRNLMSLQFFETIDIDNAHIHLIGQGRINTLVNTEEYSVYGISDTLRMVNGSSLFIDHPMDQLMRLGSYTCSNVYEATSPSSYTVVTHTTLSNAGHDNKFRVNNGSYLNIKYLNGYGDGKDYGELIGFFYMMTDDENNTCAYARPKQSTAPNNSIPESYNNPNDGGFLSYDASKNIFTIQGGPDGTDQMPYENHTMSNKNGEEYFRIWRYGGIYSYREGMISAVASTIPGYSTADVVISMPAQHGVGSYFRIKTENGFPMIDYGTDIMTVNAGVYNSIDGTPASDGWMSYDKTSTPHAFEEEQQMSDVNSALAPLTDNPNVNFGLVAIPQGSLAGGDNVNWLICNEASDAGEALCTYRWVNNDNMNNPNILFRLTYNNELTNNATWDPIIIIFEQCDPDGNVLDEIKVALAVNTVTTINQSFSTQTYALMNGSGSQADTYTAKVVLPGFIPFANTEGDLSNWTFVSATWHEAETDFENAWTTGNGYITNPYSNDMFSMQIVPSANFDNTVGWTNYDHTVRDLNGLALGTHLAYTDGRNSASFDFILHYDGRATCSDSKKKMGELEVTLKFTNYVNGDPSDQYSAPLTIIIEVFRRGVGYNYYLDGVNGDNFYAGDAPDAAKKTLSGIYNRTDYTPGDNIFIVNTVTANDATALDWNGELYGQVTLYRYPGGHALKKDDPLATTNDFFVGYSDAVGETPAYNPDNEGFAGTLVKVERSLNLHGIVLDGAYDIVEGHPNTTLAPAPAKYQVPTAPLIDIATNGVLTVYAHSKLQWNYTNSNGGAVYNAGKMIIRDGSDINHNAVLADNLNGGGVYVKNGATLIVSDSITIDNNHIRYNDGSKALVEKNSNVYLEGANSVIQIGTSLQNDGILALENHLTDGTGLKSAKIGVTKGAWPAYSYNPITYSDGGGSAYLGNLIPDNPDITPAGDYIVYDDELYYKLVTLNSSPGYEPSSDYLFWVGTWVTKVREVPTGYDPNNIDTPEELAWAISVVNGLNGVSPAVPNQNFNITGDINMDANIWVPMGLEIAPYTGTFNANGHVIKGVKSSLNSEDMGMFANLNGTVENMILNVNFTGGNSVHMGSVAAHMNGGTISNVEAAGTLAGTSLTEMIGGLVGDKEAGTIHSSFAVNTLTATNTATQMGGLVGYNAGNLYNSYANTTMSGSDHIGGLVSKNAGRIENCYAVVGEQTFPAFADENTATGQINFCYADNANSYVANPITGSTLQGHGTYGTVKDRKAIGYMYDDNAVTLVSGTTNYVHTGDITYTDNHLIDWNGLLWSLNKWVTTNPAGLTPAPTPWFRPTSNLINGDLPVLGFTSDNCLGTTDADGKYLRYGSIYNTNGLDKLLYYFNENEEEVNNAASSLFLYGNATEVTRVPESQVKVFINEDACLLQKYATGYTQNNFINTTVGISFDNSFKTGASDYFGTPLEYDWHFLSSPLQAAPMGMTYGAGTGYGNPASVNGMTGNYLPNGLVDQSTVKWDLYSFFEPQYHWINLKRATGDHWHFEEPHNLIDADAYSNESTFLQGKGYMMAISQDSYLSNTGSLNNANSPIVVNLTSTPYDDPNVTETGCNLLGNPYQAYLDMSAFFSYNNSHLGNSYWVYVAEGDNYIAGNCSASTNYALPSVTLHPHQAFFVKTDTDDVDATFSYDMATADPNGFSYFRGRTDYPLVNLFAYNDEGR